MYLQFHVSSKQLNRDVQLVRLPLPCEGIVRIFPFLLQKSFLFLKMTTMCLVIICCLFLYFLYSYIRTLLFSTDTTSYLIFQFFYLFIQFSICFDKFCILILNFVPLSIIISIFFFHFAFLFISTFVSNIF